MGEGCQTPAGEWPVCIDCSRHRSFRVVRQTDSWPWTLSTTAIGTALISRLSFEVFRQVLRAALDTNRLDPDTLSLIRTLLEAKGECARKACDKLIRMAPESGAIVRLGAAVGQFTHACQSAQAQLGRATPGARLSITTADFNEVLRTLSEGTHLADRPKYRCDGTGHRGAEAAGRYCY